MTGFVLISALVYVAGESGFPFVPLYLLVALGTVVWIGGLAKAALATAVAVGGYLAAASSGGASDWYAIGLDAAFILLFCALAWTVGRRVRGLQDRVSETSVALAAERRRAERAEEAAPRLALALGLSDLDGILRRTLEAARVVAGGSFAHVAELNGIRHRTVAEGDADAYPSWWHPTIQRLVLWSCREGRVLRSDETVHGIEGFVAVPIAPAAGGEPWGAIVLGGKRFDATEESALELVAASVAPALLAAEDSPAGRDPVTNLPNRSSLYRVLDRRLSQGRALAVLVAGLDGFREFHRARGPDGADGLLRRVSRRLEGSNRQVFRHCEDEFVVLQSGGAAKAREAALAIRRLISEEAGDGTGGALGVSVGFVAVETGQGDVYDVLDAAARSLTLARARPERIVEYEAGTVVASPGGRGGAEEAAKVFLKLAEAAEFRGPYIGEHSRAVARISRRIGARLSLPPEEMRAVEIGALLHDLGKIGIPDYVLLRSGRLTEEEHEVMRRHPILGARMLAPVTELAPALPALLHHHERFDGGGYPDGLRGEEIPLVARIVSVADAFDTLVRDRCGVPGISEEEALREIERNSGTQFDPMVVRAFLEVVGGQEDERRTGSVR